MATTYPVTVEGVGDFVFRRRTMRDQVRIEAETGRILGGPCEDGELIQAAAAIATLAVLTASAPDVFDVAEIDPLDRDQVKTLFSVFEGLREAENSFRKGTRP